MMKKLLTLLALTSCVTTEITGIKPEQADTAVVRRTKSHKPLPERDTTEISDTARVPIGFDTSVEDWEADTTDIEI